MASLLRERDAVYTIAPAEVISAARQHDGQGVLVEHKRWSAALAALQACQASEVAYPLLLANASSIIGAEWVAEVADITVDAAGHSTVRFRGLRPLPRTILRRELHKRSNGQPLSEDYIRPYVPCVLRGQAAQLVAQTLAADAAPLDDERDALETEDYVRALRAVEGRLSAAQRAMLCGHAQAPDALLDMQAIADLGGYQQYRAANVHYAAVGRLVGKAAGLQRLNKPTGILAWSSPLRSARGHFQWVLRAPMRRALVALGWVSPEAPSDDHWLERAAQQELEDEAQFREAPATIRQALVEARLGQGGYRDRLLALWGGQCALTSCDLTSVLVASHAKPWRLCSNTERLDPYNGLLLAAHADKMFDQGLIGFDDEGRLLRQPKLTDAVLASLGISPSARLVGMHRRHHPYLRAHREHFGLGDDATPSKAP